MYLQRGLEWSKEEIRDSAEKGHSEDRGRWINMHLSVGAVMGILFNYLFTYSKK